MGLVHQSDLFFGKYGTFIYRNCRADYSVVKCIEFCVFFCGFFFFVKLKIDFSCSGQLFSFFSPPFLIYLKKIYYFFLFT